MYKCDICKKTLNNSDEVVVISCNGEEVSLDEVPLEKNVQNPYYVYEVYCINCYDDICYSNWCNN